ncbi:T9SS type A sorting domain-containing protein [Tamlana sp. s12]|uniref:T9SS-dependent choice-of-anchor J family protein n=1 Tax=Tamlana sp. s12 TaxID=1630406 RepID=UPI0007FEC30B|nr:T9SS type A sorting domain-containing protein [Tamlana sp. s12]OBQ54184.1 hypothetical protein VQ01_12095 [Tamlana sp. s12]QQY81295.1 T9SS type A sorting domain-containing protein [Tamlana sp. s12]
MKKTTLLLTLCIAFSFAANAQYLQDFTNPPAGWVSYKGTVTSEQSKWEHYAEGGYMVVSPSDAPTQDWLVTPTAPITATNSKLVFDQTDILAADNKSVLTIRVAEYVDANTQYDHAAFTTVDTQTELEVTNGANGRFSQHAVDLTAYEGKTIYIAFVWEQTQAVGDALAIDNVDLIDKSLTAPNAVINPTPAHNSTNIDLDENNGDSAVLAWEPATTGGAPTSYDIYFSENGSELAYLGSLAETTVAITLNYNSTYNWVVVARNGAGNSGANATVWTFTTETDPSLSTEEHDINAISVYPNPVTDVINIKANTVIDHVEIVNSLGQQVLTLNGGQVFDNRIDLSHLNKGLYLITIKSDNKAKTLKFVKE